MLESQVVWLVVNGECTDGGANNVLSMDTIKRDKDRALQVQRPWQAPEEEVWERVIVCSRGRGLTKWMEIAMGADCMLQCGSPVTWVSFDANKASP